MSLHDICSCQLQYSAHREALRQRAFHSGNLIPTETTGGRFWRRKEEEFGKEHISLDQGTQQSSYLRSSSCSKNFMSPFRLNTSVNAVYFDSNSVSARSLWDVLVPQYRGVTHIHLHSKKPRWLRFNLLSYILPAWPPLFYRMCQGDILAGRPCQRQSSAPRRVEAPPAAHLIVRPHLCVFVSLRTVASAGPSDVTRPGSSGETALNKRRSHRKLIGGRGCRGSISNKERWAPVTLPAAELQLAALKRKIMRSSVSTHLFHVEFDLCVSFIPLPLRGQRDVAHLEAAWFTLFSSALLLLTPSRGKLELQVSGGGLGGDSLQLPIM